MERHEKNQRRTSATGVVHTEECNDGINDEQTERSVLRNQGCQGLYELALLVWEKEGGEGRKERGEESIRKQERAGRMALSCCRREEEKKDREAIPARRWKYNSIPTSRPLSLRSLRTRKPTNHLPEAYARATMMLSKVASGSSPNRSAIFSIRSGRKLPSVSK